MATAAQFNTISQSAGLQSFCCTAAHVWGSAGSGDKNINGEPNNARRGFEPMLEVTFISCWRLLKLFLLPLEIKADRHDMNLWILRVNSLMCWTLVYAQVRKHGPNCYSAETRCMHSRHPILLPVKILSRFRRIRAEVFTLSIQNEQSGILCCTGWFLTDSFSVCKTDNKIGLRGASFLIWRVASITVRCLMFVILLLTSSDHMMSHFFSYFICDSFKTPDTYAAVQLLYVCVLTVWQKSGTFYYTL